MKQKGTTNQIFAEIPLVKVIEPTIAMRQKMDEDALKDLAESIDKYGLLQPILVRHGNETYEIIAGHRRYIAHQMLGRETIRAMVVHADTADMLTMRLSEDRIRQDVSAYDEALYLNAMLATLNIKQKELAKQINMSPAYITEGLKILNYPKCLANALKSGEINFSVAREFAFIDDEDTLKRFLRFAREGGINPTVAQKWRKSYEAERDGKEEYKTPAVQPQSGPSYDIRATTTPCYTCEKDCEGNDLNHIWVCNDCLRALKAESDT